MREVPMFLWVSSGKIPNYTPLLRYFSSLTLFSCREFGNRRNEDQIEQRVKQLQLHLEINQSDEEEEEEQEQDSKKKKRALLDDSFEEDGDNTQPQHLDDLFNQTTSPSTDGDAALNGSSLKDLSSPLLFNPAASALDSHKKMTSTVNFWDVNEEDLKKFEKRSLPLSLFNEREGDEEEKTFPMEGIQEGVGEDGMETAPQEFSKGKKRTLKKKGLKSQKKRKVSNSPASDEEDSFHDNNSE